MKFLRKKNSEISLEVTPLIDIVFLLLIFFILNSQFEKLTSMELNLPKVNSEQLDEINGKNLVIEITAIEEIILNGQKLSEITFNSLNNYIKEVIFTFQKEVADRITSKPNSKSYSRLSVMAQSTCDIKKKQNLPAEVFYPTPKINSTVLIFVKKKNICLKQIQLIKKFSKKNLIFYVKKYTLRMQLSVV